MNRTVLCVDIGTTSLKAAVISSDAGQISFAQSAFENPDDRYISLKWIKALSQCLSSMNHVLDQIEAISISGNGPTVVTENGSTVLWNFPHEQLNLKINNTTNSLFLPKILSLKNLYRDDFEKSSSIFSGPEFLIWQLTGNRVTILPEKRYEAAYWNRDFLLQNDLCPEKFPPFVKIGDCYGKVKINSDCTPDILSKLSGLPVYGAGPDFIAAMIGTGCTKTGALCDCAGSSEGFNLCIPVPYKDKRIRLLPSVTPDLWNAAVMIPESGRLLFNLKNKMEKETSRSWTYSEIIDFCFENSNSEGNQILEILLKNSEYAISVLKEIAGQCNIEFPDTMFVAGGQAKNSRWMNEKEKRLGIKLEVSSIPDAELLGDWKTANAE